MNINGRYYYKYKPFLFITPLFQIKTGIGVCIYVMTKTSSPFVTVEALSRWFSSKSYSSFLYSLLLVMDIFSMILKVHIHLVSGSVSRRSNRRYSNKYLINATFTIVVSRSHTSPFYSFDLLSHIRQYTACSLVRSFFPGLLSCKDASNNTGYQPGYERSPY